jgi:hypothetical protein
MTGNVSFSSPLFHVVIDKIEHFTSQSPTIPEGDTMPAHMKDVYTYRLFTQENAVQVHSLGKGP